MRRWCKFSVNSTSEGARAGNRQRLIRTNRKALRGFCQANANQSPLFATEQVLGDTKIALFAKGGVTRRFEPGSPFDISLMVEMIVHRRVD